MWKTILFAALLVLAATSANDSPRYGPPDPMTCCDKKMDCCHRGYPCCANPRVKVCCAKGGGCCKHTSACCREK
jgi:hypothetical protein